MNKFFAGAFCLLLTAGFVACGDDSSSANNEESFKLAEGVIWQSSYGARAMTFFNPERTEDNFFTLEGDDGLWWLRSDTADGGKSTSSFDIDDSSMVVKFNNVYSSWKKNEQLDRYEPAIWPYSDLGMDLAPERKVVDLSSWEGLCLVYESTTAFYIFPVNPELGQWHWRAEAPKTTDKKSVFQFKFADLKAIPWEDPPLTLQESLKKAQLLQFEVSNENVEYSRWESCGSAEEPCTEDLVVEEVLRIYKMGKYGACGTSE